ncbi:MAG: VRR-NUC domain-containing protein [Clostridia bacterium]|nr:VRR-NUC domain-containing protein [Clostridia bacterium]
MLESEIEKQLVKKVESLGCGVMCKKFTCPGYAGMPDRIILLSGGQTVFVELKQPGKKERLRQRYVQSLLRKSGFTVFSSVCDEAGIDRVVQKCKEMLSGVQL